MKRTVKIEKKLKKATSRKNKNSSGPISYSNLQVYFKEHLFRSVFHTPALAQYNTEL